MRIILPETDNKIIGEAIDCFNGGDVELFGGCELAEGMKMVASGEADAIIAGIDHTTRDVILAARDNIGIDDSGAPGTGKTFSSCFLMRRGEQRYILADGGVTKHPTEEQLHDIILQTVRTARKVLDGEPKVAVLSYSTLGSGGKDEELEKIRRIIKRVKELGIGIMDGEVQLDAAVDIDIARKKGIMSEDRGNDKMPNVLICPDLASANILYKAMERFGGFVAAGPILQGFKGAVCDLSRGATKEDVLLAIEVVRKIAENREEGH